MNIAIFTKRTTFHDGYGGLETQNQVLAENLVAQGHKVVVFSPKSSAAFDTYEHMGVTYIFIDAVYRMGIFFQGIEDKIARILKKISPKSDFSGVFSEKGKEDWIEKSFEAFQEANEKYNFDIILCQSAIGLGVIKNKSVHKLPIVSISHGSIIGEYKSVISGLAFKDYLSVKFFLKFIRDTVYVVVNFFSRQRDFIHGSSKVIAVSEAVKRQLINETFAEESKFVVINNGIVPPNFQDTKKKSEVCEIIYVGRIDRSKGIHILLDSLAELTDLNWRFSVVGGGPEEDILKAQVAKLAINDRVNFLGKIPYAQVLDQMYLSDIFVLPSIRVEGFPMVLVEAMFATLPVIATNIGGNSDAVDDGETGFLVEPNDKNVLKAKLKILINDEALRTEFGKNARIKAEKNFTLATMVNKYMKVMKEVIENENS